MPAPLPLGPTPLSLLAPLLLGQAPLSLLAPLPLGPAPLSLPAALPRGPARVSLLAVLPLMPAPLVLLAALHLSQVPLAQLLHLHQVPARLVPAKRPHSSLTVCPRTSLLTNLHLAPAPLVLVGTQSIVSILCRQSHLPTCLRKLCPMLRPACHSWQQLAHTHANVKSTWLRNLQTLDTFQWLKTESQAAQAQTGIAVSLVD